MNETKIGEKKQQIDISVVKNKNANAAEKFLLCYTLTLPILNFLKNKNQ